MPARKQSLGRLHNFGPITVLQRPGGAWAVEWTTTWEFGEFAYAIEQVIQLMMIERATSNYRVAVHFEEERIPGSKKKKG